MFETPQKEHAWLEQLVGKWRSEGECFQGPDQPPQKNEGTMTCRSLGGLWLIAEGRGEGPDGSEFLSIITLGYDTKKERYVGTFIASMMTHLWPYSGVLDATGKKLPLESEGPSMDGKGMAKYRDTIEIVDKDHWLFYGEIQAADGSWQKIMTSHNYRV